MTEKITNKTKLLTLKQTNSNDNPDTILDANSTTQQSNAKLQPGPYDQRDQMRSQEDWQQTRGYVAEYMDTLSKQVATDAILSGIPRSADQAAAAVTKVVAAFGTKSEQVRDGVTDALVIISKPESHNIASFNDPETPTKGDLNAPWQ